MPYNDDFEQKMELGNLGGQILRDWMHKFRKVDIYLGEQGPIWSYDEKQDREFYQELERREQLNNDAKILRIDGEFIPEEIKIEIKTKRFSIHNISSFKNWIIPTRHIKKYIDNKTKFIFLVVIDEIKKELKHVWCLTPKELLSCSIDVSYQPHYKEECHKFFFSKIYKISEDMELHPKLKIFKKPKPSLTSY